VNGWRETVGAVVLDCTRPGCSVATSSALFRVTAMDGVSKVALDGQEL